MNSQYLVFIPMALFGLVVGLLAKRKNRDPVVWGIAGAFLTVITLIVLATKSYLCPNCKQELSNTQGKEGACPLCGPFKKA